MIKIKGKWLLWASIVYVYLPIVLFIFTWTKFYFALAFAGAMSFCFYRMFKRKRLFNRIVSKSTNDVEINVIFAVIAVLFFVWIGYYSGWGRYISQTDDWHKHNAVLADLVNRNWPVKYVNGNEKSMLSYYIAQYMVPGLVGKICNSFRVAEITVMVWNVIGMLLVYLNIVSYLKLKDILSQGLCMCSFPFFSIPLWVAELVLKRFSDINRMGENQWFYYADGIKLQYSSNYTQLSWVFPQCITIWLITILLIQYKKRYEYYALMIIPALLFGTFGFLGICVLALGAIVEEIVICKQYKKFILRLLSPENISLLLTEGLLIFFYIYGNVSGKKDPSVGFMKTHYNASTNDVYIVFVLVNVLIFAYILWNKHWKNGLYYAAMISLIIIPHYKMGMFNDFGMRASIPALFFMMVMIFEFVKEKLNKAVRTNKENFALLAVIILLVTGMYYPFSEFTENVKKEDYNNLGGGYEWETMEEFANRDSDHEVDVKYNYYIYDMDDDIFCQYIAANYG